MQRQAFYGFLILASVAFAANENKLAVQVYYESLCPDSIRFITKQLYPLKKSDLGNHLDVELVPYGKSTTTQSPSGSYTFNCHHGPSECEGNIMQACALKYINSTELQLDFIYCSMSSKNPPQALPKCAEKLGIDPYQISICTDGAEGLQLLAINGDKTHALKPKVYFVPWVTYNGVFTVENLQNSQTDFKGVVCKELDNNGVSPNQCKEEDSSE